MERFWTKVSVGAPGDCWEWQAATNGRYGVFYFGDRQTYAHRVAHELVKGQIPHGLVIDHLCRNPLCVNPGHLRAVSQSVNVQSGLRGQRTHCPQGHEYTPENTRYGNGRTKNCRSCKACEAERARRKRREKREAVTHGQA
jgi:hypothetical protein